MKAALKELVGWVDSHYGQGAPTSTSSFELSLGPELLAEVQEAVEQSRSSSMPVVLATKGVTAATVAANLVWADAGIAPDRILRGDLAEDEFERLIACVAALAAAPVRLDDSTAADGQK
jgi:replicative DNA helicase